MSRFRRVLRWGLVGFLGAAVLGVLGLGLLYFLIAPKLPDVDQLRNVELQEPMYVYARDGRLMALFGETRRYPVDIREVPLRQKQAFIAIEEIRF
jgi:penicillin-binding protein 1A